MQIERKIETGFIELAESILNTHKKILYHIRYKTFEKFCNEELRFTKQTIYIYIGNLKLLTTHPNYCPEEKALDFRLKKMRNITEGANANDRKISDERLREEA